MEANEKLETDQTAKTNDQIVSVDKKNVMACIGNVLLIRTFNATWSIGVTTCPSYLEAYDLDTGKLLWFQEDIGIIDTFLVIDETRVVLRTNDHITALNIHSGKVLWSQETQGYYSIISGE